MSALELIRVRRDQPSLFARVRDAIRGIVLGPYSPRDPAIAQMYGGPLVHSGVAVNDQTAMAVSAFFSAVTLVAWDIASLPLLLYRRLPGGGKDRYESHPLFRLLHDQPNPEMTSFQLRAALLVNALAGGAAFAEIVRDPSGRPIALWHIDATRCAPYRPPDGSLAYRVLNSGGGEAIIAARDMLHIVGPSGDGLHAFNPVRIAREALGLSIAAEQFGAAFFGNGSTFGGIITYPHDPPPETKENNRKALERRHQGVDRAHKLLALYGGASFHPIGTNQRDSQFNELRVHQIREIARYFRMPPHKLGDLADATYSNVEQMNTEYFVSCLRPWLVNLEQEFNAKLVSPLERTTQRIEHATEGFLRLDTEKRAEFYRVMASSGLMTPNEIRALENLPPIPGGDVARVPMNTGPLQENQ